MKMKVLNLFNLLPDNPNQAENLYLELVNELLEEGSIYAHELSAKAKLMVDTFTKIRKLPALKNMLMQEVGDGEENFGDYKITGSYRSNYDFSSCNDSYYNELIKKQTEIKEQIKEREKDLINVPEDGAATDDGEVINYCQRTSKKIYSLSFIKPKAKKVKDPITELFG